MGAVSLHDKCRWRSATKGLSQEAGSRLAAVACMATRVWANTKGMERSCLCNCHPAGHVPH